MQSKPLVRARRAATVVATLVGLFASPTHADPEDPFSEPSEQPALEAAPLPKPARTPVSRRGYQHWLGGAYLGRGLRFNNPYRLRTVLGDQPESLSLSATYLDLHAARTFSDPDGFEHGAAAHLSIATDGIRQEVFTPSYLLVRRLSPRFLSYGRAGFPIVLEPDASVGLEAGLGGAYFLSANFGIGAELDFSVFYGAATIQVPASIIPLLSLSLGVFFDWEHLP